MAYARDRGEGSLASELSRADLEGMGESDEGLELFCAEQASREERASLGVAVLRSTSLDTPELCALRRRVVDLAMMHAYAPRAREADPV